MAIARLRLHRGKRSRRLFLRFQESRQHVAVIGFQRLLFVAAHQIDIELSHAHILESFQFLVMRLGRADQAEAVYHFVRYKVRVARCLPRSGADSRSRRAPARTTSAPAEDLPACTGGLSPSHDSRPAPETSARARAQTFRSSETHTGAAAMTSIFAGSRPAARAPSLTKPMHQSISAGSANCRMIPSATRPAMCRTFGP